MSGQKPVITVVIISGYSGAGKTVALRALEDSGYFCLDNLPLALIESFLASVSESHTNHRIGIGVDIREKEWMSDAETILTKLRSIYSIEIIFLEAEREVLVRRFRETRRPHPLMSADGILDLEDAIHEEGKHLGVLRDRAERIIDTSMLSPHQLRSLIVSYYGSREPGSSQISVSITSFGFKFGTPSNLDLLFDVRFLPNPYFIPELRQLTGRHKTLVDFVMSQPETKGFFEHLYPLIDYLIPLYLKEGKTYLTIGIGCTGGRHRSPVIAEEIAVHIKKKHALRASMMHRDMETHTA